jgi:hypothetical protein
MHTDQKEFLQDKYDAAAWHGRGRRGQRLLKDFSFTGSEIHGWTLHRIRRDEYTKPVAIHSFWRHGDSAGELVAIDVFECTTVKAAHDQLLEALGNMESDAVKRHDEKNSPGDVAFGLGRTMVLFARANLVVLIRNAGPDVVHVEAIARGLDARLTRWGELKKG